MKKDHIQQRINTLDRKVLHNPKFITKSELYEKKFIETLMDDRGDEKYYKTPDDYVAIIHALQNLTITVNKNLLQAIEQANKKPNTFKKWLERQNG